MCEVQNPKKSETVQFIDFIVSLFDENELKILEIPAGKEKYTFKQILLHKFSNKYLSVDFETSKFEVAQSINQIKTKPQNSFSPPVFATLLAQCQKPALINNTSLMNYIFDAISK